MKKWLLKKLLLHFLNECLKRLLKSGSIELVERYEGRAMEIVSVAQGIVDALRDGRISEEELDIVEEKVQILFSRKDSEGQNIVQIP